MADCFGCQGQGIVRGPEEWELCPDCHGRGVGYLGGRETDNPVGSDYAAGMTGCRRCGDAVALHTGPHCLACDLELAGQRLHAAPMPMRQVAGGRSGVRRRRDAGPLAARVAGTHQGWRG